MSETTTVTLTDFLLARIAEDEAAANDARRLQDYMPYGAWDLDRVLAECEAKREVVKRMETTRGQVTRGVEMGFPNEFARVALVAYEDDVRTLASVYSDHPDFRAEWRPYRRPATQESRPQPEG